MQLTGKGSGVSALARRRAGRFGVVALAWLGFGIVIGSASQDKAIDFNRDVRPIFTEHCAACHGGVKQAGGISVVYRERLLGEAKSGHRPVVPGDVEASEIIYRVTTTDPNDRMPPVDEHPEGLSGEQIAILKRWIEQGAPWGDYWSWTKPEPPKLPEVRRAGWPLTELDRYVLARLESEFLEPSPAASPDEWLRRVSFDLIGLPPTMEERERFLRAWSQNALEARSGAVDRLLESPHFGERWASVWLDQVRYADSRGLGQDGKRSIWKYRDWVIDAYNSDMPYDQFTVKQIAGDLLPGANVGDRIATAAHRNTQSSEEGGTDDEEFRVLALLDRVSTTWQTWQGITFGCVQCHSHPYDPISHEEYYRFAAFFNNTADCDLDEEWPIVRAPIQTDKYDEASRFDEKIHQLREAIWRKEFAVTTKPGAWRPLRIQRADSSTATELAIESQPAHDEFRTVDTVTKNTDITLECPMPEGMDTLTALRVTGMPLDPEKAVADSEWGFVLSHVKAELVVPEEEAPRPLPLARVIGDEPHPFLDPDKSLDEKSGHGFGPYSRIHYPRAAAFVLAEPAALPAGAVLRVRLNHRVMLLGAFSLVTRRGHLAVSSDPEIAGLVRHAELEPLREELSSWQKQRNAIPSTSVPVLAERPEHLQRPTHVFVRGLFLDKDKRVSPGVPASFHPLNAGQGEEPDRLDLARWLVSPENPLTARVAVNRFWARLFGTGLVVTEEDFGSSGETPSHPELLDYLAYRFSHEWGWSVKRLLREMVLSQTYGQEARHRPELRERDPENRLLARGPRVRLSAEMLRDQALRVAGLLDPELHGEPVHPPIPDGVWKPFQGGDKWETPARGKGDRYRRSIYTYTKRSIPYPMFAAFDAPSREFCTPRRLRSNTPLQALMTLNDEVFAECAQGLARRMKYDTPGSVEDKLRAGYVMAASREPSKSQMEILRNLYDEAESRYAAQPELRDGLAGTPDGAAFTVVAGVLLNLDESIVK